MHHVQDSLPALNQIMIWLWEQGRNTYDRYPVVFPMQAFMFVRGLITFTGSEVTNWLTCPMLVQCPASCEATITQIHVLILIEGKVALWKMWVGGLNVSLANDFLVPITFSGWFHPHQSIQSDFILILKLIGVRRECQSKHHNGLLLHQHQCSTQIHVVC